MAAVPARPEPGGKQGGRRESGTAIDFPWLNLRGAAGGGPTHPLNVRRRPLEEGTEEESEAGGTPRDSAGPRTVAAPRRGHRWRRPVLPLVPLYLSLHPLRSSEGGGLDGEDGLPQAGPEATRFPPYARWRSNLADLKLPPEAALAALDLAVLYLDAGHGRGEGAGGGLRPPRARSHSAHRPGDEGRKGEETNGERAGPEGRALPPYTRSSCPVYLVASLRAASGVNARTCATLVQWVFLPVT